MGVASGNPAWQNYPSTATPISAAALQRIEDALDRIDSEPGEPGPQGEQGIQGIQGPAGAAATTPVYSSYAALPAVGVSNRLYTVRLA